MAHVLNLKGRMFVCLSKQELDAMFMFSKIPRLLQVLVEQGTILDVLVNNDRAKMREGVKPVSKESAED